MKDTIKIDGYTVTIMQDESPENPFTAWDCEPPLLVYSLDRHSRLKSYNDTPETLAQIAMLIPESVFCRGVGNRVKLIRSIPGLTLREFAEFRRDHGLTVREAFAYLWHENFGAPSGWGHASEWFDTAEWMLNLAGIPCHNTQSNGYSQGDSVLLLAIATPEWCERVGCSGEHRQKACECATELYGAWAWGDVYGIASIHAPGETDDDGDETEGEEIRDGSVWEFYGNDHEKSGLLDSARESIAWHKQKTAETKAAHEAWLEKESAEALDAACRDIATV